jgi:hypothetical protein
MNPDTHTSEAWAIPLGTAHLKRILLPIVMSTLVLLCSALANAHPAAKAAHSVGSAMVAGTSADLMAQDASGALGAATQGGSKVNRAR